MNRKIESYVMTLLAGAILLALPVIMVIMAVTE